MEKCKRMFIKGFDEEFEKLEKEGHTVVREIPTVANIADKLDDIVAWINKVESGEIDLFSGP